VNTGLEQSRVVVFSYGLPDSEYDEGGKRADRHSDWDYGPGQRYDLAEALTGVTMKMGDYQVRGYELGYQYYTQDGDPPGGTKTGPKHYHLMLTNITEIGRDGSSSLPSISFTYGQEGHLTSFMNGYGGVVTYESMSLS